MSLLLVVALSAASCSSGPPDPPSPNAGTVEHRVLPVSVSTATFVDQGGQAESLSALRGKTVMLVPFLTLCSDICPMTTGNLLQVERSLRAAHLANRVQIVELSVDPDRDIPARLAAYAKLTGADWPLVTESDVELTVIARYFGFSFQKVPQDTPPSVDWWTGKPLTYDVNHSDGYVLISPTGVVRFSTGSSPDFSGRLNPTLHAFLNAQGRDHLAHPPTPGWTPSDALGALGWLLGTPITVQEG